MGQIQAAATGVVSSINKAVGTYKGVEAKKELIASNAAKNDLRMANTKSQMEHRDASTKKLKQDMEMASEKQAQKIKESESRMALNAAKTESINQSMETQKKQQGLLEEKTKAQTENWKANTEQRNLKSQMLRIALDQNNTMTMNKERIDIAEKRIMELKSAQSSINNHIMKRFDEMNGNINSVYKDISVLYNEHQNLSDKLNAQYEEREY